MFQVSLVNQIIHAAIADSFLVFLLLPISPVMGDFSEIALKYPNDITTDRAGGVAQMARDILSCPSPYAILKRVVVNIRSIEGWVFTTDGFPARCGSSFLPGKSRTTIMFIAGSVSYSSHGSVGCGRRRAPSVRRVSCAVLWRDGYGETFRWSDFPDCNVGMFSLNVVLQCFT